MDLYDKFYIPRYKYELVEKLSKIYNEPKSKFRKKSKKQLYAIYFNTLRRKGLIE